MAKTDAGGTKVDTVHDSLRADILTGRLRPGDRLKFPPLSARFGLSPSVVREALNRLADQGLVRMQPHLGFQVTPLSVEDLQDLVQARVFVESEVFRLSIAQATCAGRRTSWPATTCWPEPRKRTPSTPDGPRPRLGRGARRFHQALLQACPNRRLRELAVRLRQEFKLYRHWSDALSDDPDRDAAAEHQQLVDAAVARDADLAAERLAAHIAAPAERLLRLVAAGELPDTDQVQDSA